MQSLIADTATLSVSTVWMTHSAIYHPRCTKSIRETKTYPRLTSVSYSYCGLSRLPPFPWLYLGNRYKTPSDLTKSHPHI